MTSTHSLRPDDRAAVTALSHALTLGMSSILILALLMGVTGFLDDQRSVTAEGELRTIGNRLAGELSNVDQLGQQGGGVTLTTDHPNRVAGSTFDARLEHEPGGGGECASVTGDTCLVLTAAEFDIDTVIPVQNQTALSLSSHGAGRFTVRSAGSTTTTHGEFTAIDLTSRLGIGSGVNQDSYETLGSPGNRPPIPKFTFSPGSPQSGTEIRFDAGASFDPDGSIVEYGWDFDGDDTMEAFGPVVFTNFSAGEHTITLEVQDDHNTTTNLTRSIDVSGLKYLEDMDSGPSGDNSATFSVKNEFSTPITIQKIMIDPHDDSIDHLNAAGPEIEFDVGSGFGGTEIDWEEPWGGIDIHAGGRILALGEDIDHVLDEGRTFTLDPNQELQVTINGFDESIQGDQLSVGLRYLLNGTPNSTVITDKVAGADISNYRVEISGDQVDLVFDSSKDLDTIDVQVGGKTSASLSEADFSQSGSGPYTYSRTISTGTSGIFWARLDSAIADGTESGDVPVNDTGIVATGPLTWSSASDWDAATAESGLVHASFGSHVDSELALGYSRTGSGLIGYWPLDDTSDADDESGNGHDGDPEGDPGGANGIGVSTSYQFDGSDDYVSVDYDSQLDLPEYTVSAWFRTAGGSDDTLTIVNKEDEGDQHEDRNWWLAIDNGQGFAGGNGEVGFRTSSDDDEVDLNADSDYRQGDWHHVAAVVDPANDHAALWVDGSEIATQIDVDAPDTQFADMLIGSENDNNLPYRSFEGAIDEVRLYDRALDDAEINQLHDTATFGSMSTGDQSVGSDLDVGQLKLIHDVEIATSGSIRVRVHSGAGETSDWVTVPDGAGSVSVPDLSTPSDTFRLEIELESTVETQSPVVEHLSLTDS